MDAITSRFGTRRGRAHVDDILERYDEVDRKLVAKGFPETSPWWRETIARWYRSGKRQLTARCGRRGGKSSSLSRLGVVEALYGHHDPPPGDYGVVAIISTRKGEAANRLTTVKAILDALGVAYEPWGDGVMGIKLVGRRIGFQVYAASVQGVSGFTAIFVFCDEVAKWRDSDTGQNPANEVLKSVRPTMATMPNARIVLSSSPFGMLDAHFDAYEQGETSLGTTAYAPTWVANPTLTEASTRADEPDEMVWLREYKAVPQAEVEWSLLTDALLTRATRADGAMLRQKGWRYTATMDPATRTNSWTLVVAGQDPGGKRHVVVNRNWTPGPGEPLQPELILAEVRQVIGHYGLRFVITDQWAFDVLCAVLRLMPEKDRIYLIEEPWTVATKRDGYEHLLKLAQADRLGIPDDPLLKSDLLGIVKRITRSGVAYDLIERKGRHSDYAPTVALAVADARYIGKTPEEQLSEEERAHRDKSNYLNGLKAKREAERRRGGRLPATHRLRP